MTVSIREAQARLSELVDAALAGEEVILTKRGKPLVRLVPLESPSAPLPDKTEKPRSLQGTF